MCANSTPENVIKERVPSIRCRAVRLFLIRCPKASWVLSQPQTHCNTHSRSQVIIREFRNEVARNPGNLVRIREGLRVLLVDFNGLIIQSSWRSTKQNPPGLADFLEKDGFCVPIAVIFSPNCRRSSVATTNSPSCEDQESCLFGP